MGKTVAMLVSDLPAGLRQKILDDAADKNVSINETVVRVLARRFNVRREESSAQPFRGGIDTNSMMLHVAPELRRLIRVQAANTGSTIRGVILSRLTDHYGLPIEDSRRRPRNSSIPQEAT